MSAPDSGEAEAPAGASASAPFGGDLAQQHPELLVAGAFAGAFLVAKILRRLGS